MKKVLLIAILAMGTTVLMSFTKTTKETVETVITLDEDYTEGWGDGYCEGWKDVKGPYSICPITPICPIPKIECYEGYKCGYNRGFKAGMRAANKSY